MCVAEKATFEPPFAQAQRRSAVAPKGKRQNLSLPRLNEYIIMRFFCFNMLMLLLVKDDFIDIITLENLCELYYNKNENVAL